MALDANHLDIIERRLTTLDGRVGLLYWMVGLFGGINIILTLSLLWHAITH
jgi:hypothetical protein